MNDSARTELPVTTPDGKAALNPIEGGKPRPIPGLGDAARQDGYLVSGAI